MTKEEKIMPCVNEKNYLKNYTLILNFLFLSNLCILFSPKMLFQCTKEEFDIEARKLMDSNQTHLHNQFLLQLFIKCSFLAGAPLSPPLSSTGGHHRNKATNNKRSRQHNGGFQVILFWYMLSC